MNINYPVNTTNNVTYIYGSAATAGGTFNQANRIAEILVTTECKTMASACAARNADAWHILSAKYGLVGTREIIAPYDETLNRMLITERRAWARRVLYDLCDIVLPGDTVIILAGRRYREYLVDSLEKLRCRVEIPMMGMRIGEQLRWLNQHV